MILVAYYSNIPYLVVDSITRAMAWKKAEPYRDRFRVIFRVKKGT